jgi:hypothetical protein
MTDDQINRAISKACGWTEIRDNMVDKAPRETSTRVMFLPLYCSNLNAMHEAEKMLTNANMYVMEVQLKYVLSAGEFYFHATARQRAEAFLRTLGKWEEVQG